MTEKNAERLSQLNESLSALMDNEANDLDLRRVLRALDEAGVEDAAQLKATWHRYHQARAVLNREAGPVCSAGFLAGVRSAIDSESLPQRQPSPAPAESGSRRWLSAFGQGAIAASVAAVVVVAAFNTRFGAVDAIDASAPQTADAGIQTFDYQQVADFNTRLDDESLARLTQAVYKEFEEDPESLQVPVSFRIEEN